MPALLDEAKRVVQHRRLKYGAPESEFGRVAMMWTAIIGAPVKSEQVALCMIALKIIRECHAQNRDNLIDIVGYAEALDQALDNTPPTTEG